MSNVDRVEHYRQTLKEVNALWRRLEQAQDDRMEGRAGTDPRGTVFRQIDSEVRTEVANLWRDHDRFLSSSRSL